MLNTLLKDTARTGAALSATTSVALLVASANENDGCWGAINSVSHIVDGDDVNYSDNFSRRDSLIGLGINAVAMLTWAMIYDAVFGSIRFPKSLGTAAVVTAAAYAIDYHVVPDRYSPGIEKKISRNAIYAVYVVLALTLSLAPFWNRKRK
jgi:hypothetical protein